MNLCRRRNCERARALMSESAGPDIKQPFLFSTAGSLEQVIVERTHSERVGMPVTFLQRSRFILGVSFFIPPLACISLSTPSLIWRHHHGEVGSPVRHLSGCKQNTAACFLRRVLPPGRPTLTPPPSPKPNRALSRR